MQVSEVTAWRRHPDLNTLKMEIAPLSATVHIHAHAYINCQQPSLQYMVPSIGPAIACESGRHVGTVVANVLLG